MIDKDNIRLCNKFINIYFNLNICFHKVQRTDYLANKIIWII